MRRVHTEKNGRSQPVYIKIVENEVFDTGRISIIGK